jgi:large subunit ribosomal protein L3
MTQIFSPEGLAIPVTVVQAGPCTVTQIKTQATDGYNAVQLGYWPTTEKHLTRAQRGHLRKAGVTELLRYLREFRVDQPEAYQLGQKITVEIFSPGQLLDVAGTSIGRGFAGYQKRHHFGRGPMSHGSKNHRRPVPLVLARGLAACFQDCVWLAGWAVAASRSASWSW